MSTPHAELLLETHWCLVEGSLLPLGRRDLSRSQTRDRGKDTERGHGVIHRGWGVANECVCACVCESPVGLWACSLTPRNDVLLFMG